MLNQFSELSYLLLLAIFVPIPYSTDGNIQSRPWMTYGLIAANVLIYVLVVVPAQRNGTVNSLFAMWGVIPRLPSLITLFTSLFLHVSFTHLLWNVAFLWLFGPSCEDSLGHATYFVFYIAGGVAAGLLHTAIVLLFAENSAVAYAPLVGASGAISAVVGMYALRFYRSKLKFCWVCARFLQLGPGSFEIPALAGLTVWFLQNSFGAVYALFQPDRNGIAYWAHIGGFLFGMTVAEICGMVGEGMREYLFADAVLARSKGEDGVRAAVTKFRMLLQRKPDDHVVREALAAIAAQSETMGSSAVQLAVSEAYALLLEEALSLSDAERTAEWLKAFDDSNAAELIEKITLFRLATTAARSDQQALARMLFTVLVERFPASHEAHHGRLELAELLVDDGDLEAAGVTAVKALLDDSEWELADTGETALYPRGILALSSIRKSAT